MVDLGSISANQAKINETTVQDIKELLDYCATHPNTTIRYKQSNMVIFVQSDGSYISEYQARRKSGGHFILGAQHFN